MAFKTVTYKIIGMQQDLSESAASDKYSYENMNIRIDSRNNNTMLSIENEKGNSKISTINVWQHLYRNNGKDYDILLGTISTLPFLVIGECLIGDVLEMCLMMVNFGITINRYIQIVIQNLSR